MTSGQKTGLLLAGLAAYGLYKYSTMSTEAKNKLAGDIRDQGKKVMDQIKKTNFKETFAGNTANKAWEESIV